MAKIRWGILGVAHINRRLIPAFAVAADAELRAIASRSLDKATEAARAAAIPVAHGSYEALLADPNIDAVYIPLPNTLHAEWTRKAADAGKHILCEKPLTPTATEAAELVAYCRQRGVVLLDGFMWPHHPRTTRLRELIDANTIGSVRRVVSAFTFTLPLVPDNIRLQTNMAGGSLLDVGCYCVYGSRWALGAEPVAVRATARYQFGVDVALEGTLIFADDRVATFDCGFTAPLRGWLEIVGTEGVIHVPEMWLPDAGATWIVQRNEQPAESFSLPGHDQIAAMIDNVSRAIADKREPMPSSDEAVRTLRVLDALAEAARTGREMVVRP